MNKKLTIFVSAAAIAGWVGSAQAAPMLVISDNNGNSVTVLDNGGGDQSSTAGVVTFNGVVGNWSLNITSGIGSPPASGGTLTQPVLDISSYDQFLGGAGNILTIRFTDDNNGAGLGPSAGSLQTTVGGTMSSGLVFGGHAFSLNPTATYSSVGFSGAGAASSSDAVNLASGYDLGLVATITAVGGAGSGSFDENTKVPDGGLTAGLLGLALVGVEGLRRKLGKQATAC